MSKPKPTKREAPKSWTIAVFIVGGDELGPALNRDLLELERAGSSDEVNVIVATHRTPKSHSKWFEIPPRNGTGLARKEPIEGSEKDGLDERLDDFLELAAEKYPAKHYMLIMWGHASGLLFGQLGTGSQKDQLRLRDLAKSLNTFQQKRKGRKLEILGFCACALSKAEFALELRDEVDYLVSSQVGISTLMTWPFDDIVNLVLSSPSVEPASLARQLVLCFEESYEPPPVGLTALNLQLSEALREHVNGVSKTILAALDKPGPVGEINNLCVLRAFTEALDSHPYENETLVDFFDFCRKLVKEDHLDNPVRERARSVLDNGFRSFVVENARSGPKMGALHGLSIIAPDFEDPDWAKVCLQCIESSNAYFWQNSNWPRMAGKVHAFAMAHKEL